MTLVSYPSVRRPIVLLPVALALAMSACTDVRESLPSRTATEQMLLSTASDRAADKIANAVPSGKAVWVDATNFEGTDGKYAVAAIRDRILQRGARLVADRDKADVVVEIRAGALSVDQFDSLVGLRSIQLPIPLTDNASTPEIAFYKNKATKGVAKFAAVVYDAKSGDMVATSGSQYGYSNLKEKTLLFVISWTEDDFKPEPDKVGEIQPVVDGGAASAGPHDPDRLEGN